MTLPDLRQFETTPPPVLAESLSQLLRLRPWAFESHAHREHHQLFWITKGAGRIRIDGLTRGLGPNMAVFVPANTVHALTVTPITAGWVITLARELPVNLTLPPSAAFLALPQREEQAVLTGLCDEIDREQRSETPGREAALRCYAGLLGVWLVRQVERQMPEAAKMTSQQRLTKRFLQKLESRYGTHDSAADYAQSLDVTPTHLTRVCRQTTGQAVTTIIQDRALLAAREHLAFTNTRINQIASDLGFASAAYFTRLFTSRTGLSPRDFRRETANRAITPRPALPSREPRKTVT